MDHEPTESEIFTLLSERRRRLLMQMLQESDTPLTAIELAERIGDCEYDTPTSHDLRSIQLSLHHMHLPKIEEAGVVEYNDSEGTIQANRSLGTFIQFLEKVSEEDLLCVEK